MARPAPPRPAEAYAIGRTIYGNIRQILQNQGFYTPCQVTSQSSDGVYNVNYALGDHGAVHVMVTSHNTGRTYYRFIPGTSGVDTAGSLNVARSETPELNDFAEKVRVMVMINSGHDLYASPEHVCRYASNKFMEGFWRELTSSYVGGLRLLPKIIDQIYDNMIVHSRISNTPHDQFSLIQNRCLAVIDAAKLTKAYMNASIWGVQSLHHGGSVIGEIRFAWEQPAHDPVVDGTTAYFVNDPEEALSEEDDEETVVEDALAWGQDPKVVYNPDDSSDGDSGDEEDSDTE